MCIRSLEFRTISHATENLEKVRAALLFICGNDADVSERRTEGHYENPLIVLETTLKGKKEIAVFFKKLIDAGLEKVIMENIDDDCFLHLRFDKDKAFCCEIEVVKHDNVITMKGKILSYPSRRTAAVEALSKFIEEMKHTE